MEESENEIEIVNNALLNNLEDEELLVDELKVEEESQVVAIENVLVKIDTFTFPMDFVTWGIEGDLQNSHMLRRPLPSLSQAWIDTKRNPKDCIAITLTSDRELQKIEEDEIKLAKKEEQVETGKKTS